ncbi:MAG: putative DNA-binding domain-containing protein [bacterium]
MPHANALKKFQGEFTEHLRNPLRNKIPKGVSPGRMKVYARLLFNNVEGVLSACFPILKTMLGKRKWERLVRDFFETHVCKTPFYRHVPDEFIDYLERERGEKKSDPAFLRALAHYEWRELILFVREEKKTPVKFRTRGDLLKKIPVFASVSELLSYPFQVHRISPRYRPKKADPLPSFYLLFRDMHGNVDFLHLNALGARLVEILLKGRKTGEKALDQLRREIRHPNFEVLLRGGKEILEELRKKGAILGTKTSAE